MKDLLPRLAAETSTSLEYGLHLAYPDGREEWMPCPSRSVLRYRLAWWTELGCTCTPLVRAVTKFGWTVPCGNCGANDLRTCDCDES